MLDHVAMPGRFLRRLRGDLDRSNLFDQMPVVEVVRFEFDCVFFNVVINSSIVLIDTIFLSVRININTILHSLMSDNGGWGHIIDMVTRVALNFPILRLQKYKSFQEIFAVKHFLSLFPATILYFRL